MLTKITSCEGVLETIGKGWKIFKKYIVIKEIKTLCQTKCKIIGEIIREIMKHRRLKKFEIMNVYKKYKCQLNTKKLLQIFNHFTCNSNYYKYHY